MVWTIKIENGGISFSGGSLEMIGTKEKIDKDEKLQSLQLRFLTQVGENNWAPTEGFDYEGILSQIPVIEDDVYIPKERVLEVNAVKTLGQDNEVSKVIDKLEVVQDEEDTKNLKLNLTAHLINGTQMTEFFRLGGNYIV